MSPAVRNRRDSREASLTVKATLGIRDLIHSGAAAPGKRLSEVALTRRLGLSRTPIRAALARLEQEGLLDVLPAGGYAVRQLSDADIQDAIELRGVLEGTAARFAAERGASPEALARVQGLLEKLDRVVEHLPNSINFAAYVELNAAFHEALIGLADSGVLQRELERVHALPFASPSGAFLEAQAELSDFRATLLQAQVHHRAIVDAIENREGARAEALAREHSRLAWRNLDYVLKDKTLQCQLPGVALLGE